MGVSTAKRAASDQQELTALQAAYQTPGDPRYNDPATAQSIKDIQGTLPGLIHKANATTSYNNFANSGIGKVLTTAGQLAAAIYGGPAGAAAANATTSMLEGGHSKSQIFQNAALSAAAAEAAPAVGNAFSSAFPETAASLGIQGGSNSLTDALGQTTGGGSFTGPGTIAGGLSKLYSGVSGLGSSIGNALSPSGASGVGTGGGSTFGDINTNISPGTITANASNPLFNSPSAPVTNAPLSSSFAGTGTVGGGLFGGGSSFGGGGFNLGSAIASGLGGINQNSAIKKAQGQLTNSNNAQIANLDTFDPSGITSDPGYKFNLDQGNLGLQRQLAASGGLQSGAALKAASEFNQNYAGNAFNNYYQRWANQTGAKNQLLANQGQIGAQGTVGQANNLSSALSGVLNPTSGVTAQSLLSLLGKQQNPNPFSGT